MITDFIIIIIIILIIIMFISLLMLYKQYKNSCVHKHFYNVNDLSENNDTKIIETEKQYDINNFQEMVLSNSLGDELSFSRLDLLPSSTKKYHELSVVSNNHLTNISQGGLNILSNKNGFKKTAEDINKMAPNGIFTTTAKPSDLMKYSDGTFSSITTRRKGFGPHKGFEEVSLKNPKILANPALTISLGMQAMAAVSGQYYMTEISNQIKDINSKLDNLIKFHHDEKYSILLSVSESLDTIASKIYVNEADIYEIRSLKFETKKVFNEYKLRLDRTDLKKLIIIKRKIIGRDIIDLNELYSSFSKEEVELTMQMCFIADNVYNKCCMAELCTKMKLLRTVDHGLQINEMIEELKQNNHPFGKEYQEFIDEKFKPINTITKELKTGYKYKGQEKIALLKKAQNDMIKLVKDNDEIKNNLINSLTLDKEIILIKQEDGTQAFYIQD